MNRVCRACLEMLPAGSHGKRIYCDETCRWAERARRDAGRRKLKRRLGTMPTLDWPEVIRRIADSAGQESAAMALRSLNEHRRRNRQPEVQL